MILITKFNNFKLKNIKIRRNENTISDYLSLEFLEQNLDTDIVIQNRNIIKIKLINKNKKIINYTKLLFINENSYFDRNGNVVEMFGFLRSMKDSRVFHQFDFDIFNNWSKGIEYDLIKISDEDFKLQYLLCCFLWNFDNFKLNQNTKILIDCFFVKSDLDFYFLLGKGLYGDRGYFGSNLDSLEDIIIDFHRDNEYSLIKRYSIEFLNYENLEKYFDLDLLTLILSKTKMNIIYN